MLPDQMEVTCLFCFPLHMGWRGKYGTLGFWDKSELLPPTKTTHKREVSRKEIRSGTIIQ